MWKVVVNEIGSLAQRVRDVTNTDLLIGYWELIKTNLKGKIISLQKAAVEAMVSFVVKRWLSIPIAVTAVRSKSQSTCSHCDVIIFI